MAEDFPSYGGSLGDPRKITREQVKALDCILDEVDRQGLNRGILKERRHSYTRYRETLTVETILIPCGGALPELGGLSAAYTDGGWFSQKQTEDLPMPSVYRRILLEGWKTLA